ncbi:MAG: hypothetical protein U0931_14365 [Vulcanimicrobiota bacterium]
MNAMIWSAQPQFFQTQAFAAPGYALPASGPNPLMQAVPGYIPAASMAPADLMQTSMLMNFQIIQLLQALVEILGAFLANSAQPAPPQNTPQPVEQSEQSNGSEATGTQRSSQPEPQAEPAAQTEAPDTGADADARARETEERFRRQEHLDMAEYERQKAEEARRARETEERFRRQEHADEVAAQKRAEDARRARENEEKFRRQEHADEVAAQRAHSGGGGGGRITVR